MKEILQAEGKCFQKQKNEKKEWRAPGKVSKYKKTNEF